VAENPISVAYATADGTARAGSDYEAASGTVLFAAGESSKTIVLTIKDDNIYEPDQTFTANLSNPVAGRLGMSVHTVTIQDDDPRPTVSIANARRRELTPPAAPSSVPMPFVATLSAPSEAELAWPVRFRDGTATMVSPCPLVRPDYTPSFPMELRFKPLMLTALVVARINPDVWVEPDEDFFVEVLEPGRNPPVVVATAEGVIVNDDHLVPQPPCRFSPPSDPASEASDPGPEAGIPIPVDDDPPV